MQYVITFLEGVISFLSPCMLPMLPVYLSYFAGGIDERPSNMSRIIAFVVGFTVVFTALGLFAGTLGTFLSDHQRLVNFVCGGFVILFGLSYLEIISIPFFRGIQESRPIEGILPAFLFGIIYSVSLTPCVGAFLGSALMLASTSADALQGAMLLLIYSLGLGVPFLLSAVMLEKLNTAFSFIKAHYRIINLACGMFLIFVGVIMALGWMNQLLSVFS